MTFFPVSRPRRLRKTEALRRQLAETKLQVSDFVYPVFVVPGENVQREIIGMPGQYHWSLDRLASLLVKIEEAGVLSIMLFGLPVQKDAEGSESYAQNGIVQQAVALIKTLSPELIVATDVCLCSYTDHGHCGVVMNEEIDNDQTLDSLQKIAISHAEAGADIIAPSGMMDGVIQALRYALDQEGFPNVSIMSYSVKYASAFYGPFRSACDSSLSGDRKSYQMDFRNKKEALKEAKMDENEGADFLIIKPALSYLDIIQDVSQNTTLPVVAYHVSGEYAMVKAAAEKGWIDEKLVTLEALTSMKRAGAQIIISYNALDISEWLKVEEKED